jgi:hypothetical protein
MKITSLTIVDEAPHGWEDGDKLLAVFDYQDAGGDCPAINERDSFGSAWRRGGLPSALELPEAAEVVLMCTRPKPDPDPHTTRQPLARQECGLNSFFQSKETNNGSLLLRQQARQ